MKSLPEGKKDEKKMTNQRSWEIPVEEGSSKRGVERVEVSLDKETDSEAKNDSGVVSGGTQLVTIFLWTLILNISGYLETLKFCHLLLVYI